MLMPAPITDFIGWDVPTWSRALHFWESRVTPQGTALEIGARDGGLSLWLALKGCEVVCSDLWGSRKRAEPLHRRYGVNVIYQDIDATAIPYEGAFDVIAFKSVLGALGTFEKQRQALASMHRALKPGGRLLFAENVTATPVHRYLRRRARRAYPRWRDPSLAELRAGLGGFHDVEIHTAGLTSVAWLDRLPVPASWRYMAYGVARSH